MLKLAAVRINMIMATALKTAALSHGHLLRRMT
jgi:hypothetical protein